MPHDVALRMPMQQKHRRAVATDAATQACSIDGNVAGDESLKHIAALCAWVLLPRVLGGLCVARCPIRLREAHLFTVPLLTAPTNAIGVNDAGPRAAAALIF